MKLTKKSQIYSLTFLLTLVYFASYVTRINFATVMVEFIRAENVAKSAASLITTTSFITYGTGQLLSGVLADRFSPRMLIFTGFVSTVVCNLLIPFVSPSIPAMMAIWGINGVAQAFMWPPIVKIMTAALTEMDYANAVSKICFGSAGGTLAVYLLCPIVIKVADWKTVFFLSAIIGALIGVVFLFWSKRLLKGVDLLEKKEKAHSEKTSSPLLKTMVIMLPVVLMTIALQGMLRDGISTWVPTFVSETFNLGSELSILISVVLPIFHVLCTLFTYHVYKMLKNNTFIAILVFFGGVLLSLICLRYFGTSSLGMAIASLAFTNGLIHCVNALQTCYLPIYYKDSGKISTYTGILNFATYIGSALSTWLFAKMSENYGWNTTIFSWILLCIAGVTLTAVCYMAIRKKIK